ncbi:hypothetical protein BKA70DRAFT_1307701 [Coprinopsis sp. MPI-PUGE-AT-0042]|nr:hypothetical protein BKA70DRAFT_1307701 [Coprinopsis sp. MPI-PUGE-AT-0042]
MVHVSAPLLLTALAISPSIAAPFGVQYGNGEARDFDEVEVRVVPVAAAAAKVAALTASKIFNTLATSVQMGNVFGGFFKKKTPPPKRSFMDEAEDLSSRAVEENVEYLLVRDEDGSYNVYTRTPISGQGLLKIGSAIGKFTSKIFGSSKYVLPAVAAGGVAMGTAAGARANSRRSLEEDEEIMLVRGTDSLEELDARGIDLDEELFERLFYNDNVLVEREIDELD